MVGVGVWLGDAPRLRLLVGDRDGRMLVPVTLPVGDGVPLGEPDALAVAVGDTLAVSVAVVLGDAVFWGVCDGVDDGLADALVVAVGDAVGPRVLLADAPCDTAAVGLADGEQSALVALADGLNVGVGLPVALGVVETVGLPVGLVDGVTVGDADTGSVPEGVAVAVAVGL